MLSTRLVARYAVVEKPDHLLLLDAEAAAAAEQRGHDVHPKEWLAEVMRRYRGEVTQLVLAPALVGHVERHTQEAGAKRQHGMHPDTADVDRVAPHGVQRDLRRLGLARLGDAKKAVIQPHRHHPRHHLAQPRTHLVTEADAHHPLATRVGVADLEVDQRARGIEGRPDDSDRVRQRIEHRDDQRRRRAQQRLERSSWTLIAQH
jgi:hypothetical protein